MPRLRRGGRVLLWSIRPIQRALRILLSFLSRKQIDNRSGFKPASRRCRRTLSCLARSDFVAAHLQPTFVTNRCCRFGVDRLPKKAFVLRRTLVPRHLAFEGSAAHFTSKSMTHAHSFQENKSITEVGSSSAGCVFLTIVTRSQGS